MPIRRARASLAQLYAALSVRQRSILRTRQFTATGLDSFTVNGQRVVDGQTVNLPHGTTSAVVVANPNPGATAGVASGGNALVTGDNAWSKVITAEDGVTTHTYTLNLHVA